MIVGRLIYKSSHECYGSSINSNSRTNALASFASLHFHQQDRFVCEGEVARREIVKMKPKDKKTLRNRRKSHNKWKSTYSWVFFDEYYKRYSFFLVVLTVEARELELGLGTSTPNVKSGPEPMSELYRVTANICFRLRL